MKLETYKAKFLDAEMKETCCIYTWKIENYLKTHHNLTEIKTQRESIIDAEIKLSEKIMKLSAITEEDKKALIWNLSLYMESMKEAFDNAIFMLTV